MKRSRSLAILSLLFPGLWLASGAASADPGGEGSAPGIRIVNPSDRALCGVYSLPGNPDLLKAFDPRSEENLLKEGPVPPGGSTRVSFSGGFSSDLLARACGDGPDVQFHGVEDGRELVFEGPGERGDGLRIVNGFEEPACYVLVDPGEGFEEGVWRDLFEGASLEPGEERWIVPRPEPGYLMFADCGGVTLLGTVLLEETTSIAFFRPQIPNRALSGYWVHNLSDRPICQVLYSSVLPRGDEIEDHLAGQAIAPGEAFLFLALIAPRSGVMVEGCGMEVAMRQQAESARGVTRVEVSAAGRRTAAAATVAEPFGDEVLAGEASVRLARSMEMTGAGEEALRMFRRAAEVPEADRSFESRLASARRHLALTEALLRRGRPESASPPLEKAQRMLAELREEFMLSEAEIEENDRRARVGGGDPIRPPIGLAEQVELVTEERRARMLGAGILAGLGQEERAVWLYRAERDTPIEHASFEIPVSPQLELQAELSVRLSELRGRLGFPAESLEEARRARRLSSRVGDVRLLAESLVEEGRSLLALNRHDRAEEALLRAERLTDGIEDLPLRVRVLHALHRWNLSEGGSETSEALAKTSLKQARRAGNEPLLVEVLATVGREMLDRGETARAETHLQEALERSQALESEPLLDEILLALGTAEIRSGHEEDGLAHYSRVLDRFEVRRATLRSERLRSAYGARVARAYDEMVTSLWDAERHASAFEIMERARARTLEARLRQPGVGASPTGLLATHDRKLQRAVERLRRRVDETQDQVHGRSPDEELVKVLQSLEKLLAERERLLRGQTELPSGSGAHPSGSGTLRAVQESLAPGSRLIEFFVARDRTLVLVIAPDSVRPFSLDLSEAELAGSVRWLLASLESRADVEGQLQDLYDRLIRPLEPALDADRWILVPHRSLHSVPFAALRDGEAWLSHRVAVSVLPRAKLLPRFAAERTVGGPAEVVAVGAPETEGLPLLKYARREVEALVSLTQARSLIGSAATEDAVRDLAPQAGILHLAVHGRLNLSSSLFSSLRLRAGPEHDGRLEVHEIYDLDLSAATDLVVLSACSTREGSQDAGEEILSLSRAFLGAGAQSVVSSLWRVEDEATALLMERFYRHLGDGLDRAEALRHAQADVRNGEERHAHPYYWAAFLLTGAPGPLLIELDGR